MTQTGYKAARGCRPGAGVMPLTAVEIAQVRGWMDGYAIAHQWRPGVFSLIGRALEIAAPANAELEKEGNDAD